MPHQDRKFSMYADWGVSNTPFFKPKEGSNPGFFTPYHSLRDAGSQLAAPFVMPSICFVTAIIDTLQTLRHAALIIWNIALYNEKAVREHSDACGDHFVGACYFASSILADTIRALSSLLTRTLSTIFAAIGRGFEAACDAYVEEQRSNIKSGHMVIAGGFGMVPGWIVPVPVDNNDAVTKAPQGMSV